MRKTRFSLRGRSSSRSRSHAEVSLPGILSSSEISLFLTPPSVYEAPSSIEPSSGAATQDCFIDDLTANPISPELDQVPPRSPLLLPHATIFFLYSLRLSEITGCYAAGAGAGGWAGQPPSRCPCREPREIALHRVPLRADA